MTPAMTESASFGRRGGRHHPQGREEIPSRIPITRDLRALVEDLAIDSLDLVGVILQFQDHFDVVIEEDVVPHLCRIADLAAHPGRAERLGRLLRTS